MKSHMDRVKELKATMTIDVNAADARVFAGVEAQVRNATAALPQAEEEYKKAILDHIVLICVHGKGAEEFANIARYVFKTLVCPSDTLFAQIKDFMLARGCRQEYNQQEHFMLLEKLQKIKVEYGILQLPPINTNTTRAIYGMPTFDSVRHLLDISYGNQLDTIGLGREIASLALKAGFDGKTLPVVVYSEKAFELDDGSLRAPKFTYEVDKSDDASVKVILDEVKSKLSKSNEEKTEEIVEEAAEVKTEPKTKTQKKK